MKIIEIHEKSMSDVELQAHIFIAKRREIELRRLKKEAKKFTRAEGRKAQRIALERKRVGNGT